MINISRLGRCSTDLALSTERYRAHNERAHRRVARPSTPPASVVGGALPVIVDAFISAKRATVEFDGDDAIELARKLGNTRVLQQILALQRDGKPVRVRCRADGDRYEVEVVG